MMKYKKALFFLLIGIITLAFANSTTASTESVKDALTDTIIEKAQSIGNDEDNIITPFASQVVLNTSLTGANGSQSEYFSTTSAMPYYKVWIHNTSNQSYTVTVTKDSPTGAVQTSFSVPAGQQREVRMQSHNPGVRYVNITSTGGHRLSGSLAVRVASTSGELG